MLIMMLAGALVGAWMRKKQLARDAERRARRAAAQRREAEPEHCTDEGG